MVSPSETYFASTPVIAMKSSGCLRFRECPRAGGGGRLIGFRRAKASPPRWPNLDAARARRDLRLRQAVEAGTSETMNRCVKFHQDELRRRVVGKAQETMMVYPHDCNEQVANRVAQRSW